MRRFVVRAGPMVHSSGLMPAARTTDCQRSRSSLKKAAVSAGVLATGADDKSANFLLTSGALMASLISADNFSASSIGVPGGAMMANQVTDRKSGKVSAIAGTSGS